MRGLLCLLNAKCDFNRTFVHSSFVQSSYISEPPIASKCQMGRSCHQLTIRLHLPPGGCTARGETLLLKFLYPEAKAFNGHCFACYMRRWHYNHLPRTKLDFDSLDRLFIIQLF